VSIWSRVQGIIDPRLSVGPPGPTGPAGPAGADGAPGATGATGAAGPMQPFGLGQARVRNIIGTGLTTTVRQYAATARTSKSQGYSGRYLRFMLATAPAQNENLTAHVYQYTSGGFINTASNWTQLASQALVLAPATVPGIVQFDLGAALNIPADTLFAIGLSSIMAVAGASAEWFMTTVGGTTIGFVGGGWVYVPGSAVDYAGGVLGASASNGASLPWWEFSP
jgi:hypothetical protein